MSKVTRKIPRDLLYNDWGIPWEPNDEIGAAVVDTIDNGSGRWESYHTVIFIAPDDGFVYSADYTQGLTEYQDQRPWEDETTVTITRVANAPKTIVINNWVPVEELPVRTPKVPTISELRAGWKANLEDAAAEAEDATW